ncbi:MAG: choice-of-anchor L domain-containing protein [Oceanihabitans sp.]
MRPRKLLKYQLLKFNFSLSALIYCFITIAYSQQITVNTSLTAQELIENSFVQGCVDIVNINSTINGSTVNLTSFGSFNSANSNFPFTDGIVLTTGNAASAGNTNISEILNDGNTNWGTDADLETALGINNTYNATSIEFDITSISNQLQFRYLLASEEYAERYLCDNADSFVFLIKETGSSLPYTNVAIVPETTTPVSTQSIHAEIFGFCPPENEAYFEGYNIGDTNYDGRTVPLTATATITPYVQYHVKLILAEQFDSNYDTAVFIEGNSFSPTINLGDDISTCSNSVVLNADIGNAQATYAWYLNNTQISGEALPQLTATQSGVYKVEISIPLNGSICIIEDEIEITLSSEQNTDPIADFEICDDSSNNQTEVFDLSLMDANVLAAVPPANYSISYHLTLANAQANTNAITSPITNTSNPQTIYVRIEDNNSICLAYAPINLVVQPAPTINVTPLSVCDVDNDGFAEFDLSIKDSEIINGQANAQVSYHTTQNDANTGSNPITAPYTNNSSPSEQLFIRLLNTNTGCYNTAPLTIDINGIPIINTTDPIYIDACDTDHDGFAAFDLTQITNQVLQGISNVSVAFFETQIDAENNTNQIANPTNFTNTIPNEQTLYIRVQDNNTGCATIRPFEIHTNLLLTATRIFNRYICDIDNDGVENTFLSTLEVAMISTLQNVNITFYTSPEDQQNNTNAIDETVPFTLTNNNSPQTFYITIENANCTEVDQFDLFLAPIETFNSIVETTYCDTNDDGFTTIDLSSFDNLITNNTPGFEVHYFLNQTDADNNENELPTNYDNIANPFDLFVRIRNTTTGCYSTNSFTLTVLPAPTVTHPSDFIVCDTNQDTITTINLEDKIPEIVSDTNGLNISFFTNLDDANNNVNAISDATNFSSTSQTVYIRIENINTTCFAIETLDIYVSPLPLIPNIVSNYNLCEDDNDQTSEFILSTKDNEILNGQNGMEVSYYETLQNAIDKVFPIDKNSPYSNLSSPQIIFIRVENIANTNCFSTSDFEIEVSPNPIYNTPQNLIVCDSDGTNDGFFEFDFNAVINNISQASSQTLNITFHLSQNDAVSNSNQLPLLYTNTTPNQQIFARIENNFSCFLVEEFGLSTLIIPEVTNAEPLTLCDTNYDGINTFDITAANYQILDIRQDNLTINYYTNLNDLDSQINPIQNPNAFQNTSNPQTVFISILNTETGCYAVVPVELISNLPPLVNTNVTTQICDNDSNSYNLTNADNLILDNSNNVNLSYHATSIEAESNTNPLANAYTYQTNNDTIFVRAENSITGCHTVTSFVLEVNPLPNINTIPNLETCDTDYDSIFTFDLSQQTPIALGTQNPSNFTVSYHNSQIDADLGENNLNTNFTTASTTVYVRIEDNNTGCFSTSSFDILVYRKPIVNIENQTICLENLPLVVSAETGFATDTYLWSTNATTPEIDISTIGTYSVTITTENNCSTTATFIISESEQATIEFTEQVDFSNPNSITVTINGIGNYLYVLDNGVPQESNFFNNVSIGLHTITVIDLNGCSSVSKEIIIMDVPQFLTPNNDGYFDTWHITGVSQIPGTVVIVFDRYGKILTTLTHNSNGWDGKYNGNNMPANDYWYLAKVIYNEKEFELRGHFTLKR